MLPEIVEEVVMQPVTYGMNGRPGCYPRQTEFVLSSDQYPDLVTIDSHELEQIMCAGQN